MSNMLQTFAVVLLSTFLAFTSCKTSDRQLDVSAPFNFIPGYGLTPELGANISWQAPMPGRYLGYAVESETSHRMPVVIDLIYDHQQDQQFTFQALIRASQGGFQSHYYQTYYVSDWLFNSTTNQLSSKSQPDFQATFDKGAAESSWTHRPALTGTLELAGRPFIFEVTFQSNKSALKGIQRTFADHTVFPILAGQYTGHCQGDQDGQGAHDTPKQDNSGNKSTRTSHLYISPAVEQYSRLDFPGITANSAIGSFADDRSLLCPNQQLCISQVITAINFLPEQKIELTISDQTTVDCELEDAMLVCQSCRYRRDENQDTAQRDSTFRQFTRPTTLVSLEKKQQASFASAARNNAPKAPAATAQLHDTNPELKSPSIDTIEGQYAGYLHHESSDALQFASLVVSSVAQNTTPTTTEDTFAGENSGETPNGELNQTSQLTQTNQINGAITINFGDASSHEFIAYRLASLPTNDKNVSPRITTTGDGFLMIDYFDENQIRGAWYSQTYGRVGTMVLFKDQLVTLPDSLQAHLHKPLNGFYQSSDWQMEILTSAGISDSKEQKYPISIYGWVKSANSNQRRRHITSGFYDFYTGYLSMILDDGSRLEGQVQQTSQDNTLQLSYRPHPRYGNIFEPTSTMILKKTRSETQRQVLLTP